MTKYEQVRQFLIGEKIKKLKAEQKVMEVRLFVEEAKRKQAEYELRYNHNHDPKNGRFTSGTGLTGGGGSSTMKVSGAVSGALDRYSEEADEHAQRYYEAVRHMKTDVSRIAKNTGFSESEIRQVKDFIFMEKHDLGSIIDYFAPDYCMAQSWQRLIEGKNIQKHDLTMLRHEIMEQSLMKKGMSQEKAHLLTSKKFNYSKEADEYYDKIKKHSS